MYHFRLNQNHKSDFLIAFLCVGIIHALFIAYLRKADSLDLKPALSTLAPIRVALVQANPIQKHSPKALSLSKPSLSTVEKKVITKPKKVLAQSKSIKKKILDPSAQPVLKQSALAIEKQASHAISKTETKTLPLKSEPTLASNELDKPVNQAQQTAIKKNNDEGQQSELVQKGVKLLRYQLPRYPNKNYLIDQGLLGKVLIIKIEVLNTGSIGRVELVQSVGDDYVDRFFLKYLRSRSYKKKWQFSPKKIGNRSVTSWVELPLKVDIKGNSYENT